MDRESDCKVLWEICKSSDCEIYKWPFKMPLTKKIQYSEWLNEWMNEWMSQPATHPPSLQLHSHVCLENQTVHRLKKNTITTLSRGSLFLITGLKYTRLKTPDSWIKDFVKSKNQQTCSISWTSKPMTIVRTDCSPESSSDPRLFWVDTLEETEHPRRARANLWPSPSLPAQPQHYGVSSE